MTEPLDPSICRLRLRRALREARIARGFSQKDVAEAQDWSVSKLLRIEGGAVGVSTTDLRALLELYQLRDPDLVGQLTKWAQAARRSPLSVYRDVLSAEFLTYLNYEGSAAVLRQWEPLLVPGLLQTEGYARAIIDAFAPEESSERIIERQIEARMSRQEILRQPDAPEMFFIVDESVLRRQVGRSDTMTKQLEYLRDQAERPHISIQILPFSAGAHRNMRTPFVILDFKETNVEDLLFLENPRGDLLDRDDGEELALYLASFWDLESRALATLETASTIDAIISDLG
ncbi:helix-turn-helix transcriptional regulator [Phytohabitans sp. ZYX-F-186]|uniref:Helix-turn-helix transcriptional regulator n=1 Tax=Phytohabitans maris TaxID=3071409 RepID=A0ABU0ZBR4_9ACTN|nr:helix-turn-helix transcriptional regulator [Phytohabitans sp. ZYX-F-186]MDQ7904504.1 helix-turn-helix transcriptional regulator [Phytohabitans sp. ZYX-F-186]